MSERTLLVDASVWISLSAVDAVELLRSLDGRVVVPVAVVAEIETDPAATALETALETWLEPAEPVLETPKLQDDVQTAASHLGVDDPDRFAGDVALLALALRTETPVVVTDDKPLRQTCKTLAIPVSGSIGVLVRAVERDVIDAEDAIDRLYAMDEVGARFSATLIKRAERLIDAASD